WVSPENVTTRTPSITRLPLGSTSETSTAARAERLCELATWPPPEKLLLPDMPLEGSAPLCVPSRLPGKKKDEMPASKLPSLLVFLVCEDCVALVSATMIVTMSPTPAALRSANMERSLLEGAVQSESARRPATAKRKNA